MRYSEKAISSRDNAADIAMIKSHFQKSYKKPAARKAAFSVILTSALGGGSIGSVFGVPGTIVGAALGGGIGVLIKSKQTDG